jgi:hypothetical protein
MKLTNDVPNAENQRIQRLLAQFANAMHVEPPIIHEQIPQSSS